MDLRGSQHTVDNAHWPAQVALRIWGGWFSARSGDESIRTSRRLGHGDVTPLLLVEGIENSL